MPKDSTPTTMGVAFHWDFVVGQNQAVIDANCWVVLSKAELAESIGLRLKIICRCNFSTSQRSKKELCDRAEVCICFSRGLKAASRRFFDLIGPSLRGEKGRWIFALQGLFLYLEMPEHGAVTQGLGEYCSKVFGWLLQGKPSPEPGLATSRQKPGSARL